MIQGLTCFTCKCENVCAFVNNFTSFNVNCYKVTKFTSVWNYVYHINLEKYNNWFFV